MPHGTENDDSKAQETRLPRRKTITDDEISSLFREIESTPPSDLTEEQVNRVRLVSAELRENRDIDDLVERLEDQVEETLLAKVMRETGMNEQEWDRLSEGKSPRQIQELLEALDNFGRGEIEPEPNTEPEVQFVQLSDQDMDDLIESVREFDYARERALDHLRLCDEVLRARRDYLKNNPTWKDKVRAVLKHGFKGVDKEIEKLDREIEAIETARREITEGMKPEARQEKIDALREMLVENKRQIEQRAAVTISARLKLSFEGEQLTPEALQAATRAAEEHSELKDVRRELKAQLKRETLISEVSDPNRSVRKMFGSSRKQDGNSPGPGKKMR